MSNAPAAAAPAPAKGGGKKKILLLVVALASVGGGASVPMLMGGQGGEEKKEAKKKAAHPPVNVPFGDVVVNLAEDRMTRYLRLKIVLKIEGFADEKEGTEHLAHYKPAMKSWLIGHVAGKSLKDVSGTMGVKRLQREVMEKFEEMLAHEEGAHSKVHMHLVDVLFEEYLVQ